MKKTCKLLLWLSSIFSPVPGSCSNSSPFSSKLEKEETWEKRQKQRWNQWEEREAEVRRGCMFSTAHLPLAQLAPVLLQMISRLVHGVRKVKECSYAYRSWRRVTVNSLGPESYLKLQITPIWRVVSVCPRTFASSAKRKTSLCGFCVFFNSLTLAWVWSLFPSETKTLYGKGI